MRYSLCLFLLLVLTALTISCTKTPPHESGERYRPLLHFTPPQNWINDPNGLVFYEGEYHLFYQYNPHGNTWGHMSWGHAVSTDLVQWQHLPVALGEYPDPATGDSTMIFSGTVVVDDNNTSGLCTGSHCLVAVYTSHVHKNGEGLRQHQSLAYSNDRGRTWTRYAKNPILDIGQKDFRDPKIFWYAPRGYWVMALVLPDRYTVQFYKSENLIAWQLLSEFGPAGDTTRIWECPDLFLLPVEGTTESRWVVSLSGGHPAGADFVGMQYFVGDFDGTTFSTGQAEPLYVNFGKDFYAGIVFNHVAEKTIMMGWANNWAYGGHIPTGVWRGAMALPRELALTPTPAGFRLKQTLIPLSGVSRESMDTATRTIGTFEIRAVLCDGGQIELFKTKESATLIGYQNGRLFIDRTRSGQVSFHPLFASREEVAVEGRPEKVEIQIVADRSVIEIISADGLYALTEQVFPPENGTVQWNEQVAILQAHALHRP